LLGCTRYADPGYYEGDPEEEDAPDPLTAALSSKEAYQHIRALPAAAGSAVLFTHRWAVTLSVLRLLLLCLLLLLLLVVVLLLVLLYCWGRQPWLLVLLLLLRLLPELLYPGGGSHHKHISDACRACMTPLVCPLLQDHPLGQQGPCGVSHATHLHVIWLR
jgi:hypothetical protein